MLFKRTLQRYGQTPEPVTPYQKAEQLWDERIGASRVQAKNWRLMAFGCFAASVALSGALVWQSMQSRVVPYVVEVDKFGEARAVAPVAESYRPADAQIAWHLARFVTHVRGVSTDPVLVRQNWLAAYDFATDRAALFLNEHAKTNDPFGQIGTRSVSVQVTSVVRASDTSFQVKWTEQVYERGSLAKTERWTAILTTIIQPPRSAEQLRKNPLGLFVSAIDWSRELDTANPQEKHNKECGEHAMTEKQDEKLDLRAAPKRKLVRFRKGVVIGGTAIAAAGFLGATMLALQSPSLRQDQPADELYNTDKKPTPDGLAALPGDYSQIQLGPPLPGDLGRPILERQRQLGIAPGGTELSAAEQRLAQQAIQAKESAVFFRIENRPQQDAPAATAQPIQTVAVQPGADRLTLDPERDQNNQQRKLDFLNQQDTGGIYNPHALQTPVSPYQVMAGSVIAASLITGVNSDLPGLVVAQVTENVYDTVTGSALLIPQGAQLIGTYDSVVAFGQSRALLVWQRIILPDGSSIQIDNLPATDAAGYAGLEDEVDYHTWQLVKGIAMATLLGVGTELTFGEGESDLLRAIRESTQQNTAQAGQRLYARYSSDMQSTSSIDDQFRICRDQAAREKWKVAGTYKDAAISGASVTLRPGIQALLPGDKRGEVNATLRGELMGILDIVSGRKTQNRSQVITKEVACPRNQI